MSLSLSIFTEASPQIGTGHLIESFNIAKFASSEGIKVNLWTAKNSPISLLSKAPCPYFVFNSLKSEEGRKIRELLIKEKCGVALFNFRRISNENILSLKFDGLNTVCIDEFGGQHLDCDVIINPLIVEKYHNYYSKNNCLKIYTGPQYLSLSPEFSELHKKQKIFNKEIETITISMGGIDRTGATLKIMDALYEWSDNAKKNVILGGGFLYNDEISKRIKAYEEKNFYIYYNVSNIESFFFESDIAFTAGGNTLYELACIGTPAITLYEDEHERENGLAFEERGFGYCLDKGTDVNKEDILNAVEMFRDIKKRETHSLKGKETVDGSGSWRILDIIKELPD